MKLDASHDLLNAFLDGTLDDAGQARVLDWLAADAAARREFARMAQLHSWLAEDGAVRTSLAALPLPGPRRVVAFRAWWVAAAVAAAIIVLLATRLWPSGEVPAGEIAWQKQEPLLAMACQSCHGDPAALLRETGTRTWPSLPAERSAPAILRARLTEDTACANGVSAENRQALLQ
jgi:hypothetical protein